MTTTQPTTPSNPSIPAATADPAVTSAVDFAPAMRPHIALSVSDVDVARAFYETLLQCAPSKVRDGYVKFEPELPALNLTLNLDPDNAGQRGAAHFGVQVKSSEAVERAATRLMDAGLKVMLEDQTTCCFSVQDKVWAVDPDGHRWEVFVVTGADAPVHSLPSASQLEGAEVCCAPGTPEAGAGAATTATAKAQGGAPCCG